MENKNILNAVILDEEYTLSGDQPVEKLSEIAEYVDNLMREIRKNLPNTHPRKIAVLAALNLAEEFFKLKEKLNDQKTLEQKIDEIISNLTF